MRLSLLAMRVSNQWGGGHLFQIVPFGVSLRLPLGFQTVPELLIVGGVIAANSR